jgi:hypothetical protein
MPEETAELLEQLDLPDAQRCTTLRIVDRLVFSTGTEIAA